MESDHGAFKPRGIGFTGELNNLLSLVLSALIPRQHCW